MSLGTTTGYSTTSYAEWPSFLPMLLMFSAFIGCCAGSTGGGIKVMRFMILFLQGMRELKRLVHPRAIYTLKLGRRAVPERIVEAVWGYFATYIILFFIFMLLLLMTGAERSDGLLRRGCGIHQRGRVWGGVGQFRQYLGHSTVDINRGHVVWSIGNLHTSGTVYSCILA